MAIIYYNLFQAGIYKGEIMPNITKTLTGSAITFTSKTSQISDQYSLPRSLKITEGPVKSSERCRKAQS